VRSRNPSRSEAHEPFCSDLTLILLLNNRADTLSTFGARFFRICQGDRTESPSLMTKAQTDHGLRSNRLLGALEPASRKRIDSHLEPIEFKLGDMVCDAGGLLKHAYFPQGSVLSLLTVLENGAAIETANIGREGAFGALRRDVQPGLIQPVHRAAREPYGPVSDRAFAG
jgi:hypothetical protein